MGQGIASIGLHLAGDGAQQRVTGMHQFRPLAGSHYLALGIEGHTLVMLLKARAAMRLGVAADGRRDASNVKVPLAFVEQCPAVALERCLAEGADSVGLQAMVASR